MINIVRTIKSVAKRAVLKDWEKPTTNYWHGFWIVLAVILVGTFMRWQGYPWNGNPITWYQANQLYEESKSAAQRQDAAISISKLREAIRQYPTDKRFYAELAKQEIHQNDISEAIDAWERCLKIDQNQPDAWISLAQLQLVAGDKEKADKAISRALKLDASSADAHAMKALVLLEQNKTQDAATEFAKTESLERESARFWNFAGSYYAETGKTAEAGTALRQACDVEPTNALYQNAVGRFLLQQKDYRGAKEYLDHAARLDPQNPQYWVGLAQAFYGMGEIKFAIRAYAKASELRPADWRRLEELGNLQMVDHDYKGAVDSYKRACEVVPGRRKLWDSLIKALFLAERFPEAKVTVVRFMNFSPENEQNPVAWKYLGQLLQKEGATDDAKRAYEKCIALSKSSELTAFCRQQVDQLSKQKGVTQ